MRIIWLSMLLVAASTGLGASDQGRAQELAGRLAELVEVDDTSHPDPVRRPGLGDWRFRYDQALRADPENPCVLRYRYLLAARLIGNNRMRDVACSSADGGETCGWVELDFTAPITLERRSGEDRRDRPDAVWFRIQSGSVHLNHSFLSTNRSHHLLLEEALSGLAETCGKGTVESAAED